MKYWILFILIIALVVLLVRRSQKITGGRITSHKTEQFRDFGNFGDFGDYMSLLKYSAFKRHQKARATALKQQEKYTKPKKVH